MGNGGGQADVFGKTNPLMVPKAVPIELRSVPERVPLPILGEAPELTDLLAEGADGEVGITKGLSQLGQPPAFATAQYGFQPFRGEFLSRHGPGV